MARHWQTVFGALAVLGAALLSGCATSRMIDTEVKSFAGTPPAPRDATYRFERLPSQEGSINQNVVEALAAKALAKVGPVLASGNPAYSMQVQLQLERLPRDPRYEPWTGGVRPAWHSGGYAVHGALMHGGMGFSETPWYRNRLHLVMRDLSANRIAFESSALFESPWPDAINILPVMLDAALQGYPTPPQGQRIVSLELPPEAERR
jgi:hypothetical protein